jgi:hypothetical protein
LVPLAPLLDRAALVYRLGGAAVPESKGGPAWLLLVEPPACGSEPVDPCAAVKGLARIRLTREPEADVVHKPHRAR